MVLIKLGRLLYDQFVYRKIILMQIALFKKFMLDTIPQTSVQDLHN